MLVRKKLHDLNFGTAMKGLMPKRKESVVLVAQERSARSKCLKAQLKNVILILNSNDGTSFFQRLSGQNTSCVAK